MQNGRRAEKKDEEACSFFNLKETAGDQEMIRLYRARAVCFELVMVGM